ncbi:shufflon system plasmid conjugative transfer pilus tip adhesin PilV [Photorhabdus heterorhabditis]|uniref:Shufflon system plasmid conjugative transfer pilus tip adhesin PilV n=1 Tax=Photorhabdus heterorhabditis TaxID=880156 RepID=A0A5B0X850_9GAMM|nr:shufflon system plasmid conjugative transfer pilus tip adhesin PilV [Photorhabdus heterorhabditis]KAA1195473.1 shufflon system plasmid conjugative transfer pilus tip adhesin PilV [Photorhabdus heterorhabditis]
MNKKSLTTLMPHRGFVSLEVLAALAIISLGAIYAAEKYSEYLNEKEWSVAATHASTFNEAAKQYIADNTDTILTKPLPFRITSSLLIKEGYLQKGFSEKNSFGQGYVTGVVKNSKLKNKLQALTCSVNGSEITYKGLRAISTQISGLGGYIDEKNIATGAYNGWSSQPKDFGIDCKKGHIAIALSSEVLGTALQESDRLYRFNVNNRPELNRMYTSIDMNGNNLDNADKVNAKTGQFSKNVISEGDIKSNSGWLVTQNNKGWMNSTHEGGFYMSDKDWIRSVNNKGIYSGGQIKAKERLTTEEYLLLEKVAIVGMQCSPKGLISRDKEGAILACQAGKWSKSGGTTAQLSEKGWWKDEGTGLIYQWSDGIWVGGEEERQYIKFPIPFPNKTLSLSVTARINSRTYGDMFFQIYDFDKNGVTVIPNGDHYGSQIKPYVIAIGY